MFHVVLQKKFYAIALIVALFTLKASLSSSSLQNLPSDLHSSETSSIIGTITETNEGTPLRFGRERLQFQNFVSVILPLATGKLLVEPARDVLPVLLVFSAWVVAIGKEQSAAPQSDMVSRK